MRNWGGWRLSLSPFYCGSPTKSIFVLLRSLFVFSAVLFIPVGAPQGPPDRHVLIVNEVGLSHSLTDFIIHNITEGVQETSNLPVEFHSENLDLISSPDRPTRAEIKDWLV